MSRIRDFLYWPHILGKFTGDSLVSSSFNAEVFGTATIWFFTGKIPVGLNSMTQKCVHLVGAVTAVSHGFND